MKYNKDGFTFVAPSKRKNKKYDVFINSKYITSFGDTRFQQYYDRIGHYANLNHNSEKRRQLYYARHGKTATKGTAKWFSHHYLW